MPTTNKFDIVDHLDEQVGWVTIFPTGKDWTVEPTYVVVDYLKDVRDTFALVASMQSSRELSAANVRHRTIQYLATVVPRGVMNNVAQSAAKHARLINRYIERLEGKSA